MQFYRPASAMLFGALLALSLAGCALGGDASSAKNASTATPYFKPYQPSPTPIPPTIPSIHSIALGGYQASLALPGAAGIVLDPAAKSSFAGMPSLAFYTYSTQNVEQIATAPTEPDGSIGGILGSAYSGDWIAYVTADGQQNNWILWAYNVNTAERVQVDSQASEGVSTPWTGPWVMTNTHLVWSVISHNHDNGQTTSTLHDFDFSARQTQTLYSISGKLMVPLAMNDDAILLREDDMSGNAPTYLFRRGSNAPTQISTQTAGNAWMSSRYVVWDNAHAQSTTLYDLQTGTETENWSSCIRPAAAAVQPYVACLQFASDSFMLVHIPDGGSATFAAGQANLSAGGQVYNGRVVFVTRDGGVSYFDLPTQ